MIWCLSTAGAPGHLQRNYRAYVAGIHARLELVRQQRTSQTLKSLVEVSRRLTAVDFVAFMLLFDDLQKVVLHRHGQSQQKSGIELWTMERHTVNAIHLLSRNTVSDLRWWCFFSTIGKSYLSRADLKNLWAALLFSKLGRHWPSFVGAAYFLLLGVPKFQDCQLQLPVDRSAGQRLIPPRCQCGSRVSRHEGTQMQISLKLFGRKRRLNATLGWSLSDLQ